MISKKYVYDYDDYEDGQKDAKTMAQEILEDPERDSLEEIVVGCWGESYGNSVQSIIDMFVENREKFCHIKSLFIGDMDYEECEVSWIEQGDYSRLWSAYPQLESLIIKGAVGLSLGEIHHQNLKRFEIICGGLPVSVIDELAKADLPALEKLNLYIGVDNYGFEGSIEDINRLICHLPAFPRLQYLGLGDSDKQDEITECVMKSEIIGQLKVLELSNGTLSDKGGQWILDSKDRLTGLKLLDLHYHFLSDSMMEKLRGIGIPVNLDEQNEDDLKYGNYPMLTEKTNYPMLTE